MSSVTSSTIQCVSSFRIRHTQQKSAPIPLQQRKEFANERAETQAAIDDAVDEWFSATTSKANELAQRFNKKPRYFLDMFFHGGARMVNHHQKVNAHNAFVSLKAQELRDEGRTMSLVDIQRVFKEEYNALDEAERLELIKEHKENVDNSKHHIRPSPRGRIQDLANTFRNMTLLASINGLKTRVGVEGFFCIVRNSADYHVRPKWYFSSEALCDYMKIAVHKSFSTRDVGIKLEAFAIAGCDPLNLLTTGKKKADYLKGEIRERISTLLVDITNNPKAVMQYSRYEEDIVQRYGIILIGWTYDRFVNPSELSTSLPPLTELLNALKSGACKFVKLTPAERKEREATYLDKIASGNIVAKKRKIRSDAGVSRGGVKRVRTGEEVDEDSDDIDGFNGMAKSAETVPADADD